MWPVYPILIECDRPPGLSPAKIRGAELPAMAASNVCR
jgi:hypothetical protein